MRPFVCALLLWLSTLAMAEDSAEPTLGVRGVDDVSARIMLDNHNVWRRQAGVPELAWSDTLADSAQNWADHLAQSCDMYHTPNAPYGENLAWASGRRLSPDRVIALWGEERSHYDRKKNRCAEHQMCGHYTQMVWKETREVGCGRSICGGAEVWVCHYEPEGNIDGETPY